MTVGEYYNVSSLKTLPNLYSRIMAADIPYFYRTGARHLNYMHIQGAKFSNRPAAPARALRFSTAVYINGR